jgi:hypothetical protein
LAVNRCHLPALLRSLVTATACGGDQDPFGDDTGRGGNGIGETGGAGGSSAAANGGTGNIIPH